jgi:hypothetical protein
MTKLRTLLGLLMMIAIFACHEAPQMPVERESATVSSAPHSALEHATTSHDLSRFDFSPIGQADCDRFVGIAAMCFRNARQRGVEVLIQSYADSLKTLRSMAGKPEHAELLAELCRQQLEATPELKAAMLCD